MRANQLTEGLLLLAAMASANFCLFAEEPLFDFTDWNSCHAMLFVTAALSVAAETRLRARYGQWSGRDQTAYQALVALWATLDRYAALLFVVMGMHVLTPLEAELFELVDCYLLLGSFLTEVALLPLANCLLALIAGLLLNLGLGWLRARATLLLLACVVGLLAWAWLSLASDLAGNALSSLGWGADPGSFYNEPKSPLVFNYVGDVTDPFDWHKVAPQARTLRFEDLFTFLLSLLGLTGLSVAFFFWANMALDCMQTGRQAVSYTSVAAGMRLLLLSAAHLVWAWASLHLVGLRLLLRAPLEGAWL